MSLSGCECAALLEECLLSEESHEAADSDESDLSSDREKADDGLAPNPTTVVAVERGDCKSARKPCNASCRLSSNCTAIQRKSQGGKTDWESAVWRE